MKQALGLTILMAVLGSISAGCSYAGVATAGDKAVVARNDNFLFGILRKVYVCKVADNGLTACQSNENP